VHTLARGHAAHPQSSFFRLWKWVQEAEENGPSFAYLRRLVSFSDSYKKSLYGPALRPYLDESRMKNIARHLWERAGEISLLEKMLFCDFHLYLPEVLTVKMDIATMANGLEARSPFLDHRLVETVASFPPEMKRRGMTTKYVLRRKLRNFLPPEILRRHKMGFGMPLAAWFRGSLKPYLGEILLSARAAGRPFFRHQYVRQMVEEHQSGRADHSHRLWLLLTFELWYRVFIEHEQI